MSDKEQDGMAEISKKLIARIKERTGKSDGEITKADIYREILNLPGFKDIYTDEEVN